MPASLEALLRHLPFDLDEVKEANARFLAWREHGQDRDKRIADLWTYCYVWRYFLTKFTRLEALPEHDFDVLVGETYQKIQSRQAGIRAPERYASWVSVLCRNAFVTYLRQQQRKRVVEVPLRTEVVAEPVSDSYDLNLVQEALMTAIEGLPGFLKEVALHRFLHQKTYEEISVMLEKDVGVVRSYTHKALLRLREDPMLNMLYEREDMEKR